MACADVDMDIQGDDEEPDTSGCRTPPRIQHYRATEFMPEKKDPLHDLLKKQPDVLGVRETTAQAFQEDKHLLSIMQTNVTADKETL